MEPDILELLSAYRDGELSPRDRDKVEKAIRADPKLQARLADMEALSARLHETLQMRATGADLAGFSDRVMNRLGPRRAPLLERLRVAISELLEFRPLQLAGGALAAAGAIAVVVGVALQGGPAEPAPQIAEVPRAGTAPEIGTPPGPLTPPGERVAMAREEPQVQILSLDTGGRDTMVLSSAAGVLVYVQ